MAELHRCPECGADMAADFAEALCPECLLRQGLCGATGGPETPGSAWAETGSGTAGGVGPTASFTASSRFVPPEPRELASYFPQLDILELLGSGGMGAVYQHTSRRSIVWWRSRSYPRGSPAILRSPNDLPARPVSSPGSAINTSSTYSILAGPVICTTSSWSLLTG